MRNLDLIEKYQQISLKQAEYIIRTTGQFQGHFKYRNAFRPFSTDGLTQQTAEHKILAMKNMIQRHGDYRGMGVSIWLANERGQLQKQSIAQLRSFVSVTGSWEGYLSLNHVRMADPALMDPSWRRSFFWDSLTGTILQLTGSGTYEDSLRNSLEHTLCAFKTDNCNKNGVTFWRIQD